MLAFEVQSHSAFLSAICRDAANTWEVDTPVKPPDVLFCIFLGNITHDQILKVSLYLFMICPYDRVKCLENLVNIIIFGCFVQLYILHEVCMNMRR